MNKNLYVEFQECCGKFDCVFCPFYNFPEDFSCEEIFQCLPEKIQHGVVKKMQDEKALCEEDEDE